MVELADNLGFLVDGLTQGFIFALLGLGITTVFGLGGVLNLAIGIFAVIAVVLVVLLTGTVGSLPVAIVLSLFLVAALGLLIDRTLLSLVYRSEGEERIVLGIFTTLGLAIALQGLLSMAFKSGYSIDHGIPSTNVAGLQLGGSTIGVIGVSIVALVLLYLLFDRTYLGRGTRTVLQDETGAILCGISPRRMRTIIFVLSATVAALAGILYGLGQPVRVSDGFHLTTYALIVSVVGGVRNITGAVAAGLFLGVVSTFAGIYVGSYLGLGGYVAELVLFGAAIVVLIVRPEQIT